MDSLDLFQIIGISIVGLIILSMLLKWVAKGSKYEPEAHVFSFMLDILFSCLIYFSIIFRNPSLSGLYIMAVSLAFFAILYYKTRKFYLHRYN